MKAPIKQIKVAERIRKEITRITTGYMATAEFEGLVNLYDWGVTRFVLTFQAVGQLNNVNLVDMGVIGVVGGGDGDAGSGSKGNESGGGNGVNTAIGNDNGTGNGTRNGNMVTLRNIVNHAYVTDISRKIKTMFETKQNNGDFIGWSAPYGFLKDTL